MASNIDDSDIEEIHFLQLQAGQFSDQKEESYQIQMSRRFNAGSKQKAVTAEGRGLLFQLRIENWELGIESI